mmetsp:Transcript_130645/g.227133  ORF Transcript_130645/g.227133 Transcript_130645/m.227133 type:complete len:125 (-) Transcript_130645:1-375(-)
MLELFFGRRNRGRRTRQITSPTGSDQDADEVEEYDEEEEEEWQEEEEDEEGTAERDDASETTADARVRCGDAASQVDERQEKEGWVHEGFDEGWLHGAIDETRERAAAAGKGLGRMPHHCTDVG